MSDPSTASAASNDTDLIKLGMVGKLAGSAPAGHSDLPAGLLLAMRGHQCGQGGNQSAQLGDTYKTAVLDGRAGQACSLGDSLGGRTDRTIGTRRCGHGLSSGPQISDLLPARTVMQRGAHLLRVAAGGTRR